MSKKERVIKCPTCGAENKGTAPRCASCGATVEELKPVHSEERERERRYQQEGFSMLWLVVSLIVQGVLTGAVIVALPKAIDLLDFEGYNGMLLAIPVWTIGGMLMGLISPGKTFIEPVVAALIVAVPTVFYLYTGQTVRTMPWFMYAIMAAIGLMFTLIGAYLGERIQIGPPPKPAD
ncbi:MAG: zinc ribbon domain-containing protein [Deltaproteobacteria bacterium]|nr:zinc ribbon domain-containing protein [Deltaproteobacteria bacterium]